MAAAVVAMRDLLQGASTRLLRALEFRTLGEMLFPPIESTAATEYYLMQLQLLIFFGGMLMPTKVLDQGRVMCAISPLPTLLYRYV